MSESRGGRSERVAERVQSEIMSLLLAGAVRDPGVKGCFVTGVRVTPDLRLARVQVRLMEPESSEAARLRCVEGLNRAAGFIRRELGPKLQLKYLPEIRFFWDDGFDNAARVEELLHEIGENDGGLS